MKRAVYQKECTYQQAILIIAAKGIDVIRLCDIWKLPRVHEVKTTILI